MELCDLMCEIAISRCYVSMWLKRPSFSDNFDYYIVILINQRREKYKNILAMVFYFV